MAPYARKNSKAYKARKTKKPRRVILTSKSLKKVIQTEIHRDIEDKQAFNYYPIAQFNSAADTSADILAVLPPVQQGTAENQRIGDDIKAKSLTIKGHMISSMAPSLTYTRVAVRMLVCQPKLTTSNTLVNASAAQWLPYVLRKGGVNMGLDGTIDSLYAPVDTDVITCWHDKIYYITQPAAYNSTSTQLAFQETVNSTKMFTINLKLRNKLLKYNGNYSAGNFPINYSPSILFSYVLLDGSGPISLTPLIMSMAYTASLTYEDA